MCKIYAFITSLTAPIVYAESSPKRTISFALRQRTTCILIRGSFGFIVHLKARWAFTIRQNVKQHSSPSQMPPHITSTSTQITNSPSPTTSANLARGRLPGPGSALGLIGRRSGRA